MRLVMRRKNPNPVKKQDWESKELNVMFYFLSCE